MAEPAEYEAKYANVEDNVEDAESGKHFSNGEYASITTTGSS